MPQPTHPDVPNAVLPSGWLHTRSVNRLSDPAFRWAITALMFSVANSLDGVMEQSDLDLLVFQGDRDACTAELVKWGLFVVQDDTSYRLTGFGEQPTKASESAKMRRREGTRDRQARRRQRVNEAVFERDGYRCVRCGSGTDLTVDHIYPWKRGGTSDPANLQTLCRACNGRKRDRVE